MMPGFRIAIAGLPPLAGFFSKDEILWKTFASGHTILWVLAVVAAFLTATYMFRLLYMAFFGERRSAAAGEGHHAGHGHPHGDHAAPQPGAAYGSGHGARLHDAPPAMAIALVVLAIGSVVAGFVGVSNMLERDGRRFTVRPEKIRLLADGQQAEAGEKTESGVLREVVYLGSVTRYIVDLDAGGVLTVVRQNVGDVEEERGRRVQLAWRPGHTYVIEGRGEKEGNE